MVVVSRRSTSMSASFRFCIYDNAKRKLVISRPPMLTLPSWSSNASHMILSGKMLKRVDESRHPCRTPTVVLNQSVLWALSYIFSVTRMLLALLLYFLIFAYKGFVPYLVKGLLEFYEVIVEILQAILAEDPEIEYLFCGAPSTETHLLFCNDFFCLWLESVQDVVQHGLTRMADKAGGFVVLAQLQVAFLWKCDK